MLAFLIIVTKKSQITLDQDEFEVRPFFAIHSDFYWILSLADHKLIRLKLLSKVTIIEREQGYGIDDIGNHSEDESDEESEEDEEGEDDDDDEREADSDEDSDGAYGEDDQIEPSRGAAWDLGESLGVGSTENESEDSADEHCENHTAKLLDWRRRENELRDAFGNAGIQLRLVVHGVRLWYWGYDKDRETEKRRSTSILILDGLLE